MVFKMTNTEEVKNKWFLRIHETTEKDMEDRFRVLYVLDEDYVKNLPQHIDFIMEDHYKKYPTQDFFTRYFCADGLSEYENEKELMQKAIINMYTENYKVIEHEFISNSSLYVKTMDITDEGEEVFGEFIVDAFRGGFEEFLEYYTENEISVKEGV